MIKSINILILYTKSKQTQQCVGYSIGPKQITKFAIP